MTAKNEFTFWNDLKESIKNHIDDVIVYPGFETYQKGFDSTYDLRDDLIDGINDSIHEIFDNYLIYYSQQFDIVNALRGFVPFGDFKENDLGIDINNLCDLAYVTLYTFVNEKGIIYDSVDDYLESKQIKELI